MVGVLSLFYHRIQKFNDVFYVRVQLKPKTTTSITQDFDQDLSNLIATCQQHALWTPSSWYGHAVLCVTSEGLKDIYRRKSQGSSRRFRRASGMQKKKKFL